MWIKFVAPCRCWAVSNPELPKAMKKFEKKRWRHENGPIWPSVHQISFDSMIRGSETCQALGWACNSDLLSHSKNTAVKSENLSSDYIRDFLVLSK